MEVETEPANDGMSLMETRTDGDMILGSSNKLLTKNKEYLGLDSFFWQYNKLYICDILHLQEKMPGIFFYKNHAMYKIDVIGVVVHVTKNNRCFIYQVDDGTGVIKCCTWINSYFQPSVDVKGLPKELKRRAQDLNINNLEEEKGYSLGDVIHVRGKLRIYREQKEIICNYHTKIDDPCREVMRIAELPGLYKRTYDIDFVLPDKVRECVDIREMPPAELSKKQIVADVTERLSDALRNLQQTEFTNKTLLSLKIIQQFFSEIPNLDQEDRESIICDALTTLERLGQVCKRSEEVPVYEVLCNDGIAPVETVVKSIIERSRHKKQYNELGCHLNHIFEELHKTKQYSYISKIVLQRCLQRLEDRSDIIRTTQTHYMLCNI